MNYESAKISTYVLLGKRKADNLQHITKQFSNKDEFDYTIIHTDKKRGDDSIVWEYIKKIISMAIKNDDDAIVICEDDHEFTPAYSKTYFFNSLVWAAQQGADYLSGGALNFRHTVFVSKNLYWVDDFVSSKFSVVYKNFFQAILNEPFDGATTPDLLSGITPKKMIMYPFISYQKDAKRDIYINTEKRLGRIENAFLKYSVTNR